MPETRLRTDRPPRQPISIPDRMVMIGPGWDAPGYGMELYIDLKQGDGRLLAVDGKGAVVAACIADANGSFTAAWTGEVCRDWPWCNDQRAIAHRIYTKYPR